MEQIYQLISDKPEYFAWAFGLINGLWLAFIHFNRKRHEEELLKVKQKLDLDIERRKKVFEMKAAHYEAYLQNIDSIHNRHQTDYQELFLPIMNQFIAAYLPAAAANDTQRATAATIQFSDKISKLTRDGMREMGVIESETNSLRLTAPDEIAKLLDELKLIYSSLFEASGKLMLDLVKITINNDQELARLHRERIDQLGKLAKAKAAELRDLMRFDLKQI